MNRSDLLAVVVSLVVGELARLRKCSALEIEASGVDAETQIGTGDLGTDSLELLHLASAVDQMFHLHDVGVEEYLLRRRSLGQWVEIVSAALDRTDRIAFTTSGSSGTPKVCTHCRADLEEEADVHARRLTGIARVLSLVPQHHIYGFIWSVLVPRHLGVEVLDVKRWTSVRLAETLRPGDLLVGTPVHWEYLAGISRSACTGVSAATSGAPCPPALFQKMESMGIGLTEVYGSSETAGIGIKAASKAPFELLPFWSREPSPTTLVRDANQVEMPDEVEWLDERHFKVIARRDGAVQVNGMNVFPARVAEVIRSSLMVKDCAVRLMRPEEGNRLKAFVVWREAEALNDLQAWLATRLEPHERPRSILFGPRLPQNEMGKLTDWDLR